MFKKLPELPGIPWQSRCPAGLTSGSAGPGPDPRAVVGGVMTEEAVGRRGRWIRSDRTPALRVRTRSSHCHGPGTQSSVRKLRSYKL